MTLNRFEHSEALTAQLMADILLALKRDIEQNNRATLVLSGGSTPIPLYQALSKSTDLDWSKVTITLTDERWVKPTDEASNQKMIQRQLLQNAASAAHFIPLTPDALPNGELPAIETALEQLSQSIESLPHPYSFTLLGMGNDGHTASLFPCSPQLSHGLETNAALLHTTPHHAPHERISMSRHELLHSKQVGLLIQGEEKWNTFEKAMAAEDSYEMPIRAFLKEDATTPQKKDPIAVYWSP